MLDDTAIPAGAELDRLILAIAATGDRQAFARLFKHFAPRLKSFLLKSGTPPGAAEEIAQETMLAVWRKASYFDPERAGAATWIFTICRNLRIDHLRRDRGVFVSEDAIPEEADEAPDGEQMFIAAEREAEVRRALQGLSAEQAAVVRLSFFNDKAHSEIASELGLPLGTVKSRVRLALNRLRTLLDEQK